MIPSANELNYLAQQKFTQRHKNFATPFFKINLIQNFSHKAVDQWFTQCHCDWFFALLSADATRSECDAGADARVSADAGAGAEAEAGAEAGCGCGYGCGCECGCECLCGSGFRVTDAGTPVTGADATADAGACPDASAGADASVCADAGADVDVGPEAGADASVGADAGAVAGADV